MRTVLEVLETAGDVAQPFWRALAEGRIDVPQCLACRKPFFFPRRTCPHCHATDIGWMTSAGRGTVFAVTVVHLPFPGVAPEDVPLSTGYVDLDEGVRLPARFSLQALPVVGQRVIGQFRDGYGGFPVFLPEGEAS